MSEVPNGLYYTKEHEWLKVEGDEVTIGITDHAQNALTDIVYIELPEPRNTKIYSSLLFNAYACVPP